MLFRSRHIHGVAVVDFTALGDTVNVTARLQAEAKAGEIVLSEDLFEGTSPSEGAERRLVQVRGREAPLWVHVLRLA